MQRSVDAQTHTPASFELLCGSLEATRPRVALEATRPRVALEATRPRVALEATRPRVAPPAVSTRPTSPALADTPCGQGGDGDARAHRLQGGDGDARAHRLQGGDAGRGGAAPRQPFAPEVTAWLADLSQSLLRDRETRIYPDVATFAYFCRRANIAALAEEYRPSGLRLGRGLVFHIAPSNVPVNFAYSLVASMLAGNSNVVRVSSKPFPQVDLIAEHIKAIAEAHPDVDRSLAVIRYDRSSEATRELSALADVRVIWGGDATIAAIRECPLKPRAFDVTFADRYSIAVINPEAVLAASDEELRRLAEGFYNDTYLFDQNACSAPHTIYWSGAAPSRPEARRRFWDAVHAVAVEKYDFQAKLAVDKLTALCNEAIAIEGTRLEPMPDNVVVRAHIDLEATRPRVASPAVSTRPTSHALADTPCGQGGDGDARARRLLNLRCAGGYFTETEIDTLDPLADIITPRYQTMATYGIAKEELERFVRECRPAGLDRIVPVGHTTDFSLTWDGYDLIATLSRAVTVS